MTDESNIMKTIQIAIVALFVTVAVTPASAQLLPEDIGNGDGDVTPGKSSSDNRQIVDGIAAVVGDKVILLSDVVQQASLVQQRGQPVNIPQDQLLKQILNDLIVSKLIAVKAEEDSVEVPEELVNRQVDNYIDRLLSQAGSEEAFEEQAGKSISAFRSQAQPIVREQLRVETMRRQRFSDVSVTDRDVETFYEEYKDSLPEAPERIEIAHIYIPVEASLTSRDATMTLAQSVADSIRNGADFATMARRYSNDPGSAGEGGTLGWTRRGRLVPEYEEVAWNLELNEVSDPVESQFGIHVIQLIDQREGEVKTRHILFKNEAGETEKQAVIDSLSRIRERSQNGESFAKLAEQYSQDDETRFSGGVLAKYPTSDIPQSLRWVIDSLTIGEVSTPRRFSPSPTESGYHIIKLVDIDPPHTVTPESDPEELRRMTTAWKERQMLAEWISDLRDEIYWEIKYSFD